MTEYNKTNLIQGAVILAVAIVLFFTIIGLTYCVSAGAWWTVPVPVAAIVYGCVDFIKKYYPKKENK